MCGGLNKRRALYVWPCVPRCFIVSMLVCAAVEVCGRGGGSRASFAHFLYITVLGVGSKINRTNGICWHRVSQSLSLFGATGVQWQGRHAGELQITFQLQYNFARDLGVQ